MSKFKLSPEQVRRYFEEIPLGADMVQILADKASEHTAQEIIKWGEEVCPHSDYIPHKISRCHKRECPDCWQDLKQSLASELKENTDVKKD